MSLYIDNRSTKMQIGAKTTAYQILSKSMIILIGNLFGSDRIDLIHHRLFVFAFVLHNVHDHGIIIFI